MIAYYEFIARERLLAPIANHWHEFKTESKSALRPYVLCYCIRKCASNSRVFHFEWITISVFVFARALGSPYK